MKIKCLLVDDEPLAISLLQNHISKLDYLEVVGTCSNALKAAEILRNTTVDLMFLDIKMPQITGFDFLKSLRNPPAVIFTTAYREYALESYELDIVDYLLKPITFDRFFKAVDRYLRISGPVNNKVIMPTQEDFIYIKNASKYNKINVDSILYIESVKDYIIVHQKDGIKLNAKYKISDIQIELQDKSFLRIHRSFIINLKNITAFTAYDVEIGTIEIPIGASYKEYVFKMLK
ncbi:MULTISPECIES: LytTR family DNA-binding domain-containing protein [unclassified Flavobacterium]|jgi:two-component system LytT family response regulator|uniref:LytR/AlgR family response regulator transcription factor n=1 Tax=unclassified Flavobacterium TaxID=196869 RepID=UPI0012A9B2FA|nr:MULTISPECIES: LytTR family DNA-binding domain-containing protein [unclassified Flavobacterium]MBF4487664.1 response regulator transcription factor [Flavobacterium sp. CSZ]QGK73811.1 response regulator [Flavobacterium sp. SLB02]